MTPIRERVRRARVRPWKYLIRRLLRPRIVDIDGLRVIVDPARMESRTVKGFYHGDHEAPERVIVTEVLARDDHVLEAGAGMGLISMIAARIVGAGNVVSYEPTPVTFSILEDNVRLNALPIDCRPRALGAKSGEMTLYVRDNLISSSMYAWRGGQPIAVPVDGIAKVLAETKSNVLIFDIEGAEIDVIAACPLAQVEKIVMEIHPHIVGDAAISRMYAHLFEAGFVLRFDLTHAEVVTFMREGRPDSPPRLSAIGCSLPSGASAPPI
jgi:FkbM family methyltransferase